MTSAVRPRPAQLPRSLAEHPAARLGVDLVLVVLCWLEGFSNQTAGWNRPFVLSCLALVAVLARRRFPLVAFLLGAPALGWAQSQLAPAVLAHGLGRRSTGYRHRGPVVVTALVLAVGVDAWPLVDPDPGMWRADGAALLQMTAVLGGAAASGAYRAARAEAAQRLQELLAARAHETHLVDTAARAQERTRLAREMHDVVSHQVSLIAIQAGALRVGAPSPQVRSAAEQIRVLAARTTDELRQMLTALRADGDQPLRPPGQTADLPRLWAESGLEGSLQIDPTFLDGVPDSLQGTVFRVAEEGLANARRHAPGARVHVRVQREARRVSVHVQNESPPAPVVGAPDRSAGAATRGTGLGLVGVEERVVASQGVYAAGRTPDGGFRLQAEFPVPGAAPVPFPGGGES